MDELPFLVVHGALVAKLLVAAMSGLGLVILRSGQRVRLRWWLRRATLRRARTAVSPSEGIVEGIVTLRGVWHESAAHRWLDCNGERVELDAEVRVHQGTRARWRWRALAALPTVRDGDQVLATGKLQRRLGTDDAAAGYRELAGAWVLGALPVHGPIELWAVQPVVCSPPLSLRTALAVIACGFASFCVLNATGAYVLAGVAVPDYYTAERTRTAIDPFEPIVIATALPGSRSAALEVLAHIVNREMIRSPAARDLSIALTGLRLGCETQAFEMIEQARFDDAVALARGCGATHPQLQALLGLGRFAEAAELGNRWSRVLYATQSVDVFVLERTLANIAAGRWAEAAGNADELSYWIWHWEHVAWAQSQRDSAARYIDCVADLLRFHAGEPDAAERLRARASDASWPAGCRVAGALVLPLDQQEKALTAVRDQLDGDSTLRQTADLILWSLRSDPSRHSASRTPADQRSFYGYSASPHPFDQEIWLAPVALGTDSASAHAWMSIHQMYAGDWTAAHAELQIAGSRSSGSNWFDLRPFERELQIREGIRAADSDSSDHGVTASFRNLDAEDRGASDGGMALVARDRAQLASALTNPRPPVSAGLSAMMEWLALRRDLARAIGDTALTQRTQGILARYLAVLADRDKAIALMLIEL